jgi:hypothetical protein
MSTNEHTSAQVASYASEIERMTSKPVLTDELWRKIRAIAGSALTQAPDKLPPKPLGFPNGNPYLGLMGVANYKAMKKSNYNIADPQAYDSSLAIIAAAITSINSNKE